MALPSSGTLTMAQIRTELGVTGQAPFSLRSASIGTYATINTCSQYRPDGSSPYTIAEWYSYCHSCTCGYGFCFGYDLTDCAAACGDYSVSCFP